MSFTKKVLPVGLYEHFEYYTFTDGSANGSLDESLIPGVDFKLDTVRLHLSTATTSVVDFRIWVSAAHGSAFNQVYYSLAASGVTEVLWGPDRELIFNGSDHIRFSLVLSTGIVAGLVVTGWTILQEAEDC